jgi:hypothetical protein
MSHTDSLIIASVLSSNIIIGLLGYLIGKLNSQQNFGTPSQSFFKKQKDVDNQARPNTISIEDQKIVTKITTDGMEKKYGSLGETKKSDENISSAVDKLKGLKK